MSVPNNSRSFPGYREIISHLRTPLYRNGYLLTLSSLATSGIGLIYWILAAHRYPAYLVGLNSAMIAAMTFLAGVSELNLMSALIRFIPMAGRSIRRFVLLTYLVSLLVSAVISFIFIMKLDLWSPALDFLGDYRYLSIWFILSTMSWCIFVLQDSVLTGLRQASWVPLENTVFSLTKIALMLIFAVSIPALGIFASWSFALVVAIIPTNYFIFRKLIPLHEQKEVQTFTPIEPRQIIRFAATDYLGALSWIVATTLMPVIVTSVSGATANAYFYLAWTIANTLYLIGPAMGSSMVVETANNQQNLAKYSYRVYKNTMRLVVPAAILIAIGAPYILMVFGKGYSSEGATLLRLLALSAIPNTINSIFVSISRVQRRTGAVVMTLGSLCILILSTSYTLLKRYGIVGVGIGWVISQTLVSGVVYLTKLRGLWRKSGQHSYLSLATTDEAHKKTSLINDLYQVATALHISPIIIFAYKKWSVYTRKIKVLRLLPKIIKELPGEQSDPARGEWKVLHVANNETRTAVAFLGPRNGSPPVIIKIPGSPKEAKSLMKQSEILISLNKDENLGNWRNLLPMIVSKGETDGSVYLAESVMPGRTLLKMLRDAELGPNLIDLAAEEINFLHRKTARCVVVDMNLFQSWVSDPLSNLITLTPKGSITYVHRIAIDQLASALHAALIGREVCISWIHGDYAPANILVDPERNKITGIVDWDLARSNELPLLDLMHLLISIRMENDKRELGYIVSDLLIKSDWQPEELRLIREAERGLPGSPVDLQDILLLTWLHHVSANLLKTSRYNHHSQWTDKNIVTVLNTLSNQCSVAQPFTYQVLGSEL